MAQLPGYFYGASDEGVWLHLYAEGAAQIALSDGRTVRLRQQTRYPWDGQITIEIEGVEESDAREVEESDAREGAGEFALFLRVPDWCEAGASLEINGQAHGGDIVPGSYVEARRVWKAGDTVRLHLPMPVRRVQCHPNVGENAGRVALMRGPLLFCVEGADHADVDVRRLKLPPAAALEAAMQPDLLSGVTVLRAEAETADIAALGVEDTWSGALYRTTQDKEQSHIVPLTAIPYYAWANREPGPMRVWLPQT